jgi:hypothetical protein
VPWRRICDAAAGVGVVAPPEKIADRHTTPKVICDGMTVAESRGAARRRRGSSPTGMAAPPILASFWGGVSVEQSRVEEA